MSPKLLIVKQNSLAFYTEAFNCRISLLSEGFLTPILEPQQQNSGLEPPRTKMLWDN